MATPPFDDIIGAIHLENKAAFIRFFEERHPADAARFFRDAAPETVAEAVELAGPEIARDMFEFLPFEVQESVLPHLSRRTLSDLVNLMSPDDRADLVEQLDEDLRDRLLALLIHTERQNVLKLLDYPENSAGAYMTTAYASLNAECSIRDALEQLRIQAINKETIYYVYVVDENRKLIGFVSLQDIIIARPSMRVREIMNNRLIFARVDDDIETTARNLIHYDFLALPVVDHEERLVGIITFDDILDVVQEEATEDMYHLANLDTDEKINTPLMESVRLRIPWLVVNLGTALVAASTVNLFGKTIEHVVAIASMMTIIATLGGNSGNQALTVVVRSLALGEASKINARDVVLKNVGVGFMNGLICGALLALISYLWFGNLLLSAITWAATAVNQIIAGFFGTLTPLALRRFNLDPALGSSVMVTTATDTGGFFILLSLATLFLHTLTGGL